MIIINKSSKVQWPASRVEGLHGLIRAISSGSYTLELDFDLIWMNFTDIKSEKTMTEQSRQILVSQSEPTVGLIRAGHSVWYLRASFSRMQSLLALSQKKVINLMWNADLKWGPTTVKHITVYTCMSHIGHLPHAEDKNRQVKVY